MLLLKAMEDYVKKFDELPHMTNDVWKGTIRTDSLNCYEWLIIKNCSENPYVHYFQNCFPIFFLSLIYSIFIYATNLDSYLNGALPFFQVIEVGLFLIILILIIEIAYAIIKTLHWTHETFKIRYDEIIHQRGLFSINKQHYALKNMEHIFCKQTVFGRIFDYGDIVLQGRFLKEPVILKGILDPFECAEFIKKSTVLSHITH